MQQLLEQHGPYNTPAQQRHGYGYGHGGPTAAVDAPLFSDDGKRLTRAERCRREALAAFGGLSMDDVSKSTPGLAERKSKTKRVMTMKDWEGGAGRRAAGARAGSENYR